MSRPPVLVGELTPGDESPVGRCPTCDALTYILKKET